MTDHGRNLRVPPFLSSVKHRKEFRHDSHQFRPCSIGSNGACRFPPGGRVQILALPRVLAKIKTHRHFLAFWLPLCPHLFLPMHAQRKIN